MRRGTVIRLLVCFLKVSLTQAQDPLMWPPSPSDIFAPGVTGINVEPVADNMARILYLYEGPGWHAYPYPVEFNEVGIQSGYYGSVWANVYERPDGSWYVFERDAEEWYRFHTWILNPATGVFTASDPPCRIDRDMREGQNSVLTSVLWHESAPFSAAWVFIETTRSMALCSVLTGYISRPLPENVVKWVYHDVPMLPQTSPDGEWVVFMTHRWQRGSLGDYEIYSYNTATDDLLDLGTITPWFGENVGIGSWLDNTRFTLWVTDMPEWSARRIFVGDASQAGSVDFAVSMLRFWPRIIIDPLLVEGMDAAMNDGASAGPCFLKHYNVLTRDSTLYDTGDLCEYGIPIPDGSGDRLYRAIFPATTVTRYNPVTGARRNLFMGEVEYVGKVSPGGRYAVIGLGNSGAIDVKQDPDLNWDIDYSANPKELDTVVHKYIVLDLETGAWVGEFPPSAKWFTDNLFTITPAEGAHRLVRIADGAFVETELPGQMRLALPERDQLVLDYADGSVKLYTVSTGEVIPAFNSVDGFDYSVQRRRDGTFRVSVTRSGDPNAVSSSWTIQLP